MRAKYGDKSVCPMCNGTGSQLIKMGRFVFQRPCLNPPPYEQPKLFPAEPLAPVLKEAVTKHREQRRGNRWHSKN